LSVKLYSNPASPFARKVRVVAHELALKFDEEINVDARNDETVRKVNPLKKIPVLVLADGSTLFDSMVICEYLNELGGGRFFPGKNIFRQHTGGWKALTLASLADGIMDAAVACRYESIEPPERRNEANIERYLKTVNAGLDTLDRLNFNEKITIGEITAGCALGYIDFRYGDLNWRDARPKLAAWFEKFAQFDSMKATMPRAMS
jgi:glutathione S-transferase